MMTANEFDWASAPLSTEDEALIDAYESIGVPVDALAYTPEFDRLVEQLGQAVNPTTQRVTYRRLLTLRKRGLLPRIYSSSSED